jgi:GNAT superfamily N-acetyltransferase
MTDPESHETTIRLERITEDLPSGFETMRAEARAEQHGFLDRLAGDWNAGLMRFDQPGEGLFVAYSRDVLAGIGGITVDPTVPAALRMRRFYVRVAFRRDGIGRKIAKALLAAVPRSVPLITLNAAAGSEQFWESLGFWPDARDGHTHVMKQLP